jgi:hypothetical protein
MITTDEARIAALASHASYGDSLSELGLRGLHDASKSMFFQQILGEDAIARMKPEY